MRHVLDGRKKALVLRAKFFGYSSGRANTGRPSPAGDRTSLDVCTRHEDAFGP
jgi:hypothetical protein